MIIFNPILFILYMIVATGSFLYIIYKGYNQLQKESLNAGFVKGEIYSKYGLAIFIARCFILFGFFFPMLNATTFMFEYICKLDPEYATRQMTFIDTTTFITFWYMAIIAVGAFSINLSGFIFGKIFNLSRKEALIVFYSQKYPLEWIKNNKIKDEVKYKVISMVLAGVIFIIGIFRIIEFKF